MVTGTLGLTKENISYRLTIMDTAITIDSDLLNKAMEVTGGQNQRQIVENALRIYVTHNKQNEVRKYRGKLQWEGNLDELRTAKWS